MKVYLDTSFLIKLYLLEVDSDRAAALVDRLSSRPAISQLSEVEMASALHRMSATSSVLDRQAQRAYVAFRHDIADGVYEVLTVEAAVFARARMLGERYGSSHLVRALDILHVAIAVRHGADNFWTYDDREAHLAQNIGLNIL